VPALVLPHDHPLRIELNDEVHARPTESLRAPLRASFLALTSDWGARQVEWQQLRELASRYGAPQPQPGVNHYSADFGGFHVKWERHSEFYRYLFVLSGAGENPFDQPALAAVPPEWLAALTGEVIVAANVAYVATSGTAIDADALSARLFESNTLIGSRIAEDSALAFTDFRIHADGFSRILVVDQGMRPQQAGRMIQRLLDIDTYRIMSLLALPVARELGPFLNRSEQDLAQITRAMTTVRDQDEPVLLERLTRLEAEIEGLEAQHHYRFSAAAAYYELVQRRIAELLERRLDGLQTFQEFTERRLAPAMNTCRAAAARQESLSERVARITQLLSTRVDVSRERQNQAILASMNRRAKVQLRLQETVEGLSVAAVTYYLVGLVGYAVKGLKAEIGGVSPDVVVAWSVPLMALLVVLALRRMRGMLK
jgi:uncharacterized membrane-anchored protein